MKIRKRDARVQKWNVKKIEQAIKQASVDAEETIEGVEALLEKVKGKAAKCVNEKDVVDVEVVHKCVEDVLMASKYKATARQYIEYRIERERQRQEGSVLWKAIESIRQQSDKDILNENANMDSKTLVTQRTLIVGEISKEIAKKTLPKDVVKAHEEGIIHFHDMTFSPSLPFTNCCLVDLKGMLENGFILGSANIGSPKSVNVAAAVTAQIIAQVSSSQYGGTSIANIDLVLEPYVKMSYEKHLKNAEKYGVVVREKYARALTEKDVFDSMQGLEYEINSLFNSHAQSPFTTVSFGTGTSWESRAIQNSILKVRLDGFGRDKTTAVFPKLVFIIEDGVNLKQGDCNYDIKQLALECSSKRLYPDIVSAKNNKLITGSSVPVTSMGCRSFLPVWKDENGHEVLDGRMNIGVVTVNLPSAALEAKGDVTKFWKVLDSSCEIAHKALQERIKGLDKVVPEIAPTLYMQGAFGKKLKAGDKPSDLFKNGRATVSLGFIGVHETVCHLLGVDKVIFNKEAEDLGLQVVQFLADKTKQWKEQEGWGYSLYATPSEGICYRLLKIDRNKYGVVKNITDKEYYTNSFHLDVREKVTPFEKIEFEAPYHFIATGGHISYCELSNIKNNLKALETIWDFAIEKLDYFGTNTEADMCKTCGFEGNLVIEDSDKFSCPSCGEASAENIFVCRRTCGYLASLSHRPANHGKTCEMKERIYHLG